MKERTSNLSLTALVAGIMSLITVFGGFTVFLGVFFALFGIICGARGKRIQRTRTADWAVIISVLGLILCSVVTVAFVGLYLYSHLSNAFDFSFGDIDFSFGNVDFRYYYEEVKEILIDFIHKF